MAIGYEQSQLRNVEVIYESTGTLTIPDTTEGVIKALTSLKFAPGITYRITIICDTVANNVLFFKMRLKSGTTATDFTEFYANVNTVSGNNAEVHITLSQDGSTTTSVQHTGTLVYARSWSAADASQPTLPPTTLGGSKTWSQQDTIELRGRTGSLGTARVTKLIVEKLTSLV